MFTGDLFETAIENTLLRLLVRPSDIGVREKHEIFRNTYFQKR